MVMPIFPSGERTSRATPASTSTAGEYENKKTAGKTPAAQQLHELFMILFLPICQTPLSLRRKVTAGAASRAVKSD
jgi:hypothetical protein